MHEQQYIPVDGIVQRGEAYVEEALLTGEQGLISKGVGDRLWAGTFQAQGNLVLLTTATGHQTMLNRIRELVRQGQRSKTSIQRQVDKVIRWFVPAILVLAISTLLCWVIWGEAGTLSEGVFSALAVLLVACPCALGLAAPISLSITSSRLVKHGLIVKDASVLERLAEVDAVIFDKTGTLTEGKLSISYMKSFNMSRSQLLTYVGALEKKEEHPIAHAIQMELRSQAVRDNGATELVIDVERVISYPGRGVTGYIANKQFIVGNERLLEQHHIKLPAHIVEIATERLMHGETLIYCIQNERCVGLIGLSDGLKRTAKKSILLLQKLGVHTIMATGDHPAPAYRIAREVGITDVNAKLLPEQKLELLQKLQANGSTIAMVGDGWNDAPALASAHIGIAMSNSTEAALHAGHMTLLYSQLTSIPISIEMSRMTVRNIKQNLGFALIYNSIMLPFAALGFLQPWMAGIAMALSSVCVVFNALSLHVRLNHAERAGESG